MDNKFTRTDILGLKLRNKRIVVFPKFLPKQWMVVLAKSSYTSLGFDFLIYQ